MSLPVIPFYSHPDPAQAIHDSLSGLGFMQISDIGIDPALLSKVFAMSREFFCGDKAVKARCRYQSAQENFGYQGVLEENLDDPAFKEKMVKFVRASMKGWKYAEANPEEAALIVLDNDQTGAQTEKHQKRMMGEIAKLTAGSNGVLNPADYQRTVDTLMGGGSDPVITKVPEGAWTHAITDQALN